MKSYMRYPVQVKIIREFTDGNLKGMTHADNMGFITINDALTWASSVSESSRVNYKVLSMENLKTGEIVYGS